MVSSGMDIHDGKHALTYFRPICNTLHSCDRISACMLLGFTWNSHKKHAQCTPDPAALSNPGDTFLLSCFSLDDTCNYV